MLHQTDGTSGPARVRVVPFDGAHAGALVRFFLALSPRSRHLRFLAAGVGATAQQLAPLLRADGDAHVAHLAIADGEVVGEARFARHAPGRASAELALAVADQWQGRGVGGRLLDALLVDAARRGIRRLTFDVLADNRRALALLARYGARWTVRDGVAAGDLPGQLVATPPAVRREGQPRSAASLRVATVVLLAARRLAILVARAGVVRAAVAAVGR